MKMSGVTLQVLSLCFCLRTFCGATSRHEHGVVIVTEGSGVMLPCSLENENIAPELFHWRKDGQTEVFQYEAGFHHNNGRPGQDELFKGRVTHFPHRLKHGNASITLSDTKVTDRGNYTCEFPLLQPRTRVRVIELVVAAAPKVFITVVRVTESMMQLQCDVQGASPEPKVEWWEGDENVLPTEESQVSERGGSFNVTLRANVIKAGWYRCVATLKGVGHETVATIVVSGSTNDVTYEPQDAPSPEEHASCVKGDDDNNDASQRAPAAALTGDYWTSLGDLHHL